VNITEKIEQARTMTDVKCPSCNAEIYVEVIARDGNRCLNTCPLCGKEFHVYCHLRTQILQDFERM